MFFIRREFGENAIRTSKTEGRNVSGSELDWIVVVSHYFHATDTQKK